MSTRANVIVLEKNGDWENKNLFYRQMDGDVAYTGKDLLVLAYMAKNYSYPDLITDDAGNAIQRENFKRIRNRFLGYLNDSESYESEDFDAGVNGDIEYLYLVSIQRAEDDSVKITVTYLETPIDSDLDKDEYVQRILNGEGKEIGLMIY